MERVLAAAQTFRPGLIDITGGAPELNPDLKSFIHDLSRTDMTIQCRTNLTILLEQGNEELPFFFQTHRVRLVASLPCYLEEKVCRQRGLGTYEKSISALQRLNDLGYGIDPDLTLDLVYNPDGPFLPPHQANLEADYRRELERRFGIRFTSLLTITNMPIGRFWEVLKHQDKQGDYMRLLNDAFNCQTVRDLMCRHQICVAWDGKLFDCDFNLALGLPLTEGVPANIVDFDARLLRGRVIRTGNHCFGCTAGFGSSCGGALVSG
jgi:radical SAM/Cys-rich protein